MAKLLMSLLATVVLLVHMQPIGDVARIAAQQRLLPDAIHGVRIQLVADAGAALLVLLVATTLSFYKPRGLTRYGWRKQREDRATSTA